MTATSHRPSCLTGVCVHAVEREREVDELTDWLACDGEGKEEEDGRETDKPIGSVVGKSWKGGERRDFGEKEGVEEEIHTDREDVHA